MNKQNQLTEIHQSGKPYIIYKSQKGFDLYTDFSKKIILNNKNVESFLKKKNKKKSKNTDLFIGFFGYELLNNLIDINLPKQKNFNFPKGIFYKPEKRLKLNNNLNYNLKNFKSGSFKININRKTYTNIFNRFKKKIKSGETYQIKICTKYKTKSKIDPLDFFSRLSNTNLAPEAFMIKDTNYSIISCSPENLITKKGNDISTKPIAGTVKKTKYLNKIKALSYFRKNSKETKEHNMIVDMERNDLSRICKVGSVIGCPKISTLNLLNKQEKENRNIYTGSFGYIKFNGDMRFNIIIRSILNFKNTSEISVASGVVIDSNANHEFNENFIKAKALIDLFK